jgi:hypothetical protein
MLQGSVRSVRASLDDFTSLLNGAAATRFAETVLLPFLRAAIHSGQRIRISAASSSQYRLVLLPHVRSGPDMASVSGKNPATQSL